MSQILRDLNKLALKVGAPVVGKNISEQVRALSTFWEGTSHGANIAERVNELAHSEIGKSEPPILVEKTITENGTYVASDDNADGYSAVTVDVSPTPPEPPADGKTRLYITLTEGRLSPVLGLGVNGSVDVDWGDSTEHGTMTGSGTSTLVTIPHTYAQGGDYVITLTAAEGTKMEIPGTTSGSQLLTKNGTVNDEARVYRKSLKKILLGDGFIRIKDNAFNSCYGLTSITIQDSVTSIGSSMFTSCYDLTSIDIPDSVTSISNNAFNSCYGLTSITIPDSVTSIGDNVFANCYNLTRVTIPDGTTSIGNSWFNSCYCLASITIPESVTSIGYTAFFRCYGLGFIKFEPTTPPVVIDSSAFGNISTDCIIYVPQGTLEAYKSAANYPNPSRYTYVEY